MFSDDRVADITSLDAALPESLSPFLRAWL